MKKKLLILFSLFVASNMIAQRNILITVNYKDAIIYKMDGNQIIKPELGVGFVKLRLKRKELNRIMIFKEGFVPLIKDFPKNKKYPAKVNIDLLDRELIFTAEPYDASIYVNGKFIGKKKQKIVLKYGSSLTVDVKRNGYQTLSKTYYNTANKDIPPMEDMLSLKNKVVHIKVQPADAEIFINKKSMGIGFAEAVIPYEQCVLVKVNKPGYIGVEKVFCNKKENNYKLPLNYDPVLEDLLVNIQTTPDDAEILVDGKIVGIGKYDLKIIKGNCVEVLVNKDGYLRIEKNYCNSADYQKPDARDHIKMIEDEAYKTSVSTDMANVNFSVSVKDSMNEDQAWKLISSIVTLKFDVLEIADRETGYLRTAWQVQNFNGKSTIRTRVIVKLGNTNPLKYLVKISSERANGIKSVKDDQEFEEWNRILKKYNGIINELQSRL